MSDDAGADPGPPDLLAIYDDTLPQVYGYLLRRCDSAAVAEDLTSETFLAAVDAARRPNPPMVDAPWLIGVARHKLADHWRRRAREGRRIRLAGDAAATGPSHDDPWPAALDRVSAEATLRSLAPQHREVLSLRYLDDLAVADCAELLGRRLHATEALLVRARSAFRRECATNDPHPADPHTREDSHTEEGRSR